MSHTHIEENIIQKVLQSENPKVKVAVTDIDGILRGKYIHKDKFSSAAKSGFGFCSVIFGWDSSDVCYDNCEYSGWHNGYPDSDAYIDFNTYRNVPWDNNISFFLADFKGKEKDGLFACPRTLLRNIDQQAQDMGFDAMFGQEFEWFNFRENADSLYEKSHINAKPITPGMFGYSLIRIAQNQDFFNDVYDLLAKFDVPIEGLHTETGPGVLEAAILYGKILDAADRAILFKTGIKEIGQKHNIMPTFMAKLCETLPGCSGHIHQSLWQNGKNTFFDASDTNNMSQTMKHYLAGQLLCLPEVLPMYAPTINSYKRLVEGMWAPTTVNWGVDNRTVCARILPASEKATRIELRIPGSDTNPYLAMSAALASGLYGIKHKLELTQPQISGNGYEDKDGVKLSPTLIDASNKMQQSDIAHELFGSDFVNHFTKTRNWEWRQHLKAVTDWEKKRYFEII
jgi:glutamine synthetase